MALGTMASSMDLSTVTKNANGAGYTDKLWAELQAAGCDQTKDFLEQHADSPDAWDIALWGASAYIRTVTIDELGIPDEDRDVVYKMLDADKQRYLEFGENSIGK